jgi:cation diffusion facilitator family transporter
MGAKSDEESRIVVYAAMAANFVIMVAKFVAAAATGSSAMLSEGIHSVVDTSNQGLLLVGEKQSKKPPDEEHPFGYGQEQYFWGLIVAMVLFGLGGGLSMYEGIHELLKGPSEMQDPTWNYAVLGIAFVAEGSSWCIAVRKFLEQKGDQPLWRALRLSKDPKLFIPIGEDTAALTGILVAGAGIFLARKLGIPQLDAVASILIGMILTIVALFLAYETRGLLIGEQADPALVQRIRQVALEDGVVQEVGRLLTMQLSPNEILLNLEVRLDSGLAVDDAAMAISKLEARLKEEDERITRVFTEIQAPNEQGGIKPPF